MTSYWYRHTESARGAWPFHNLPQCRPPHHELTCNRSLTSIPSLDANVYGKIITDLHTNGTDKHYLLHSLCHLVHTKRATSFSLALRLHRICSTDDIKRYIGETKRRPKDGLNKDHRPVSWQAYQHIRTFPRRSPRRSHSFHYGNEPQFVRHLDKERQFLPKYWTK